MFHYRSQVLQVKRYNIVEKIIMICLLSIVINRVLLDLKENLEILVIRVHLVLLDHQAWPVKKVYQALLDLV
jgi:hypothetical protein